MTGGPYSGQMPLDYPVSTRTLDNGLRIVVSTDHSVPAVSLSVWVDVGSRHEEPGRTGLAHLFEHLMFEGSANVAAGEHLDLLMDAGGRVNATTWFDRTNYFCTIPTGAVDLALWLEADRHGRLAPALTQSTLDIQRDVVKEERRQRYDNQPYGSALADLVATLFPDSHPYHHVPIGSMADLDAMTVDALHDFYRRRYGPQATVLTMVGDLEPERAFDAAERYFGGLEPVGEPFRVPLPQSGPVTGIPRFERADTVPNDRLYLGFRLPAAADETLIRAAVALDALGGLASGRLHRALVREQEVATGVSASCLGLVDGASVGFIGVDLTDSAGIEEVEEAVCAELERFIGTGPTELEMQSSLADTERSWLEAMSDIEQRADMLSRSTWLFGDPSRVNRYLDRVRALRAEDVQQAAATWLAPESRTVVAHVTEPSGITLASR